MARDFSAVPFGVYAGNIVTRAFQRFDKAGNIIVGLIDWSQYAVGGESVGTMEPQFAVEISFQGLSTVPSTFKAASIYIDNTDSTLPIYVNFSDTNYTVVAPPNSEGWYPILSNSPQCKVIGLEFETGFLPLTVIGITDLFVTPYTNVEEPTAIEQKLSSLIVGTGGSSLQSIGIISGGSSYFSGALTVSGGGGSGATAVGNVNQFGQFTGVVVLTQGTDFSTLPTITPTGTHAPPAPFDSSATYTDGEQFTFTGTVWYWNSSASINLAAPVWVKTTTYFSGNQVNYGGNIYQCIVSNTTGPAGGPPASPGAWELIGNISPGSGAPWVNSGVVPMQDAIFSPVITAPGTTITTTGIASSAAGDNILSFVNFVTGTGVQQNNMFGSPAASGFFYITSFCVTSQNTSSGGADLTFQASDGSEIPISFTVSEPGLVVEGTNCNIKLDATKNWQIVCGTYVATVSLNFVFTYTYSQQ